MRFKVDFNHEIIVQTLRSIPGITVLSLAAVGHGCPDLLVCRNGLFLYLLEIKMPKSVRRLSAEQKVFHSFWPVHIVTSAEEALTAVGAIPTRRE